MFRSTSRRFGARFFKNTRGAAAVETAILISLAILPLLAAVVEGWRFQNANENAEDALSAVTLRVGHNPTMINDQPALVSMARTIMQDPDANLSIAETCYCASDMILSGMNAPKRDCTKSCPDGSDPGRWAEMNLTDNFDPVLPAPFLNGSDINLKARVRID
jgi:Flp pilus assembly protein TadG